MKQLTREAIQRMVGSSLSSTSVGGSGGGGGGGGVSESWVNENYVSKAFFARLFEVRNGSVVVVPNDETTPIDNIKALTGLWTDQYLSALGQNSSGGGGGVTALSDLVDVDISNPVDGQALIYDATTNKWVNGAGGGGGTGTVTSITAGTGLSGGTITTSGTISISSTYRAYIQDGETAYGWGNHALAGYLTSSDLSGYATQAWVSQQGYATGGSLWGNSYTGNPNIGTSTSSASLYYVDNISMSGSIYMERSTGIIFKDSSNNTVNALTFNNYNTFAVGYGARINGYTTDIQGNIIQMAVGTTRTEALSINQYGQVYVRQGGEGLRIGDALLTWDSTNNALKIQKYDSSPANIYGTGSVSALGFSAGVSSVDAMTFGYLNVNNSITMKSTSGSTTYMHTINGDSNGRLVITGSAGVQMGSALSMNGNALTTGNGDIDAGTGNVTAGRYYLDGSRYLHLVNGNLYYYNGSTDKQIAFTN